MLNKPQPTKYDGEGNQENDNPNQDFSDYNG